MKVVRVVLMVRLLRREDVFMVAVPVQKVFTETRWVKKVFGEVTAVVIIRVDVVDVVVAVAHQLLERRMRLIHISLHGEFRQGFPRRLVRLNFHGRPLHACWWLVANRTGRYHGHPLERPTETAAIL